jgi:transposase-like protein
VKCPFCSRPGVVRHENVVRGTVSERRFFCGICGRNWKVTDRRSKPSVPHPRDTVEDRRRISTPNDSSASRLGWMRRSVTRLRTR